MKIIFAFCIIFVFLSCPKTYAADTARSYDEQTAFIFDLSDKFYVTEIGTVHYPEHEYTMYKATYGNTEAVTTRNYLFISGFHGIETAPVYAMKEFMLYLDSLAPIADIKIDFIYILNPYGFEHDYRYNGNGIDLNRDFINFETQEIKCLIDSVKDIKYTGVYDFHEHSATTGFLLYYYSKRAKLSVQKITEMLHENNIPLENKYVDIVLKAKNGAIYVPFYAKIYYMHIKRRATSGLYFDKMNIDDVFVFETPMSMTMEKRKQITDLLLRHITGI